MSNLVTLALVLLLGLQPRVLATGSACTYDPGEMARVARTRRLSLARCVDGIALREPEHLGKLVYLVRSDGLVEGPYRVVDYWNAGGPATPSGWALDVGWSTWARWQELRLAGTPGGCLPGIQVLWYDRVLDAEMKGVGRSGLIP